MEIGRKGRSCAWPPSRRVTSKSPMHAGVASSLRPHARVARRARQRRRVYQSGKKGHEPRRAGRPAGASVAGGQREGSTAPGAASAAPGRRESVSVAGRSAVFRRRRFGPALLREAPRCSCPAVACGDRGVSDSTWAAGLLFGADGVAVTVSVDRTARDASQATATTSNATTVSASMQDAFSVPSCPASFPNVSRGRRLPYLMSTTPVIGRLAHPVRFAPTARQSSGMAHPCPRGCISRPQVHHTRVSCDRGSAPGRRHPRAMAAAPAPDFHRLSGLTSLSGWLPTTLPKGSSHMAATIAPAPKRHQNNLVSTLAAAALKADLAPRHYRIAAPGDMPRKATSAASGRRCGSDGRCASDRPPGEHRHGAHHRLIGAGPRSAARGTSKACIT